MGRHLRRSGKVHVGHRLPVHVAKELLSIYEDSVAFVARAPVRPASNEEAFRVVFQSLGYEEPAIRELGALSADMAIAALRKAQESREDVVEPGPPGQQKIVNGMAVEAWIDKGWRFVSPLNGTKAVIESPQR